MGFKAFALETNYKKNLLFNFVPQMNQRKNGRYKIYWNLYHKKEMESLTMVIVFSLNFCIVELSKWVCHA